MKKFFLLSILTLIGISIFAQNSGKGFAYQAVARDAQGDILLSQNIEIRFSLMPGQFATTPSWQETHVATTDAFGTFSIIIGKGIPAPGTVTDYADIDYSEAAYWLRVEINDEGTYEEISYAALLSVPYAEAVSNAQGCPIGTIMAFAGDTTKISAGWVLCDGREVPRSGKYGNLYDVIQTSWGYGDNSTTFNLPDLRGTFLRGVDHGRNSEDGRGDPGDGRLAIKDGGNTGNSVGSWQDQRFLAHNHAGASFASNTHKHLLPIGYDQSTFFQNQGMPWGGELGTTTWRVSGLGTPYTGAGWNAYSGNANASASIPSVGGSETRPRNAYVNYIIKY